MGKLFLLYLVAIIPTEGINYKTVSDFFHIETFVSRFSKALALKKFHFIGRNIED